MNPESHLERGYNDASNDLATAIMELTKTTVLNREYLDVKKLVARFNELKEKRMKLYATG